MKKFTTIARLFVAIAVLAAVDGAHAANCLDLVTNHQYACASNDAELKHFTLEFRADRLAVQTDFGEAFQCFCTSTGSVAKPNVEAGRGITCIDGGADVGDARLLSAQVQGLKLTHGALIATSAAGSETVPFLCTRNK
jgi:hypothetical protein